MPEDRCLWAYFIHPWDLDVYDTDGKEEILPTLSVCVYEHGTRGGRNVTEEVNISLPDAAMFSKGFIAVPQDIEIMAHGRKRRGYIGDSIGMPLKSAGPRGEYWPSAFEKISMNRGRVKIEIDHAAGLAFRRALLKLLGPLSPEQIASARRAEKRL
jgi:hypothetical protein